MGRLHAAYLYDPERLKTHSNPLEPHWSLAGIAGSGMRVSVQSDELWNLIIGVDHFNLQPRVVVQGVRRAVLRTQISTRVSK